MNHKWIYEPLTQEDQEAANRLVEEGNINPITSQLLVRRGIKTPEAAQAFFRPQLHDLHDPFLMKDMDVAVNRLNEAMGSKEKIMIYGDYDVDGCTAVSLLYRFLRKFYSNLDYYIPDRYDEGYGVSKRGIDMAKAKGVSLIIVLDCGIKAVEEIAYAKEIGIDFIICDHHVPDDILPPAVAILNAKRQDATYPYKDLSGCGVGFKFMQAFAINNGISFSQLVPMLDLVAVSIASDIVPIMGENRILAFHGLRQLNSAPSVGLKAIINICGLQDKELTMNDIIFKIGPRINASGRMQNGKVSVELLIEHRYEDALDKAQQIDKYNEERKGLDKQMTEEAHKLVDSTPGLKNADALVICNKAWHKGVIGIVASRLSELYLRPSIVLTESGGLLTGSARSIEGFDIYKAIESCRDILENFGGHTYAAGLSLKGRNLGEFRRRINEYTKEHIESDHDIPVINIDAEIDFKDVSHRLNNDIKHMRPFGPDNEKPVFCTHHVYDYGTSKVVGKDHEHIKMELIDNSSKRIINGIAFGQSSELGLIKTKQSFDIAYNISDNTHKKGDIQLQIEDIKVTDD